MQDRIDYSNKEEVELFLEGSHEFDKVRKINEFDAEDYYETPTTNECQAFLMEVKAQVVWDENYEYLDNCGLETSMSCYTIIKNSDFEANLTCFEGIPQEDLELALLAACAWVIQTLKGE